MEWRDEGILLWVRRHGESGVIIDALTAAHGRHAGLVRGGGSKAQAAVLQPGAQLSLEWNARLSDHLGTFRVDLIRARAAAIMADRDALAALNVVSALLVRLMPEREPDADTYRATLGLVDALAAGEPRWPALYARWELALLRALGFGLDLESCAATGTQDDLVHVSPRSGRAVSRSAGEPYADRLLPLPQFLIGRGPAMIEDVRAALRLTGYFLEHRVRPAFDLAELPAVRIRLLRLLDQVEMMEPALPPEGERTGTGRSRHRRGPGDALAKAASEAPGGFALAKDGPAR